MATPAATPGPFGVVSLSEVEVTASRLRECPDCGLLQVIPALGPDSMARCLRCNAVLRRTRQDSLGRGLALNVAGLFLFGVACLMSLMTDSTAGMKSDATGG